MNKFNKIYAVVSSMLLVACIASAELPASVQANITSLQTDVESLIGMVATAVLAVVVAGLAIFAIRFLIRKGKGALNSAS